MPNLETKDPITLGPFLTSVHTIQPASDGIVPLNLAMEWSNPNRATRIPLFRELLPYSPDRLRFEHIFFRHRDLPCDLECLDYQVIEGTQGAFLSLDALLAALYAGCRISRSIFQLLNELAEVVPLHSTVTNPITTKGILAPEAEALGFRLNAVFPERGLIYAQIGWEADCRSMRFHVCVATFRQGTAGKCSGAKWIPKRDTGVSRILTLELHRIVPGNPNDLFTEVGLQFLKAKAYKPTQTTNFQS
jgi:hypothetical protein